MNNDVMVGSVGGLVRAVEDNMFALFRLFRRWQEATVHDGPDLLSCLTDIPFPLFNSIMRASLTPDTADTAIQDVVRQCEARGVPALWWVGPGTTPTDLGDRLRTHGFIHADDAPGMACRLQDIPNVPDVPPGLTIERVEDDERLKIWSITICQAFEMPDFAEEALLRLWRSLGTDAAGGLRNYLGWRDGRPVAAASLFIDSGVGGIYNVATVAEARGQGIGAAMTGTALRDAREAGCWAAILHASQMGERLYRRLGFEPHCVIGQYVWAPASPAA